MNFIAARKYEFFQGLEKRLLFSCHVHIYLNSFDNIGSVVVQCTGAD